MDAARKAYLLSLTQYPQYTPNESLIAHAWIEKHADEWDTLDFNVNLGSSVELGAGFSDATRRQAAAVTTKRADMIARKGQAAAIVEVKVRISLAAMGQLLGYEVLYRTETPDIREVQLIAIGHDALLDVPEALHAHGIAVELFPNVALAQLPYG